MNAPDIHSAMFKHASQALILIDDAGVIHDMNIMAEEMFGYSKDELIGKNIFNLFRLTEPDESKIKDYLTTELIHLVSKGRRFIGLRKDKTSITVDIRVLNSTVGVRNFFVIIAHDVSAQQGQQLSLDQYEAIFEYLPVPVIIVKDNAIKYINQNLLDVFGYSSHVELLGEPLTKILSPRVHDVHLQIGKLRVSGVELRNTYYSAGYTKDKKTFRIKVHASRILLSDGYAIFAILEDVSEEDRYMKKLEYLNQQLETSNRFLGNFASVASHDLREPLRKIQSFSDILLENLSDLDEENKSYLNYLVDAARRMQRMIEGLVMLSQVSSSELNLVSVDISSLIDSLVKLDLSEMVSDTGAKVEIDLRENFVLGDASLLYIVFSNLTTNALKFSRSGVKPILRIHSRSEGGKVLVSFEDNGIGIEEIKIENIFELFTKGHRYGKYSGMGIGLSLVKACLTRLNGSITVKSESGVGSTFMLELPKCDNGD